MLFIISLGQGFIPASWNAKRMAPRARSVHPLGPMKDWERSEAMVVHMAGQLPYACTRPAKAKSVKVFPNMLFVCVLKVRMIKVLIRLLDDNNGQVYVSRCHKNSRVGGGWFDICFDMSVVLLLIRIASSGGRHHRQTNLCHESEHGN
jgi:hypothetical protein